MIANASSSSSSSSSTAGASGLVQVTAVVGTLPSKDTTVADADKVKRTEMLQSREALVKRFTRLILPTLLDVYSASVALHVRTKALTGMLKVVNFLEPEPLLAVVKVCTVLYSDRRCDLKLTTHC